MNKLWFQQNRYFLLLAGLELCVLLVIFSILLSPIVHMLVFWEEKLAAPNEEPVAVLQEQVTSLEQDSTAWQLRIDSLQTWSERSSTNEAQLSFLQSEAKKFKVAIANYSVESVRADQGSQGKSFVLEFQGRYHDVGQFLNAIEVSPHSFVVESLAMRPSQFGAPQLGGKLELYSK